MCILNIRAILPNNNTPLGKAARALTDEQIIVFFCHGPFKSLKNQFSTLKQNSPNNLDLQEAGKREMISTSRVSSSDQGDVGYKMGWGMA
ncbi:hypothetical protein RSOL_339110, partial [Rhizoctonia solani AG-3 Rhs1AP]